MSRRARAMLCRGKVCHSVLYAAIQTCSITYLRGWGRQLHCSILYCQGFGGCDSYLGRAVRAGGESFSQPFDSSAYRLFLLRTSRTWQAASIHGSLLCNNNHCVGSITTVVSTTSHHAMKTRKRFFSYVYNNVASNYLSALVLFTTYHRQSLTSRQAVM